MGVMKLGTMLVLMLGVGVNREDPDERLYGRVSTAGGDVLEGYLRWDRNEASWSDFLEGQKEIPWEYVQEAEDLDPEYALERKRERTIEVRLRWRDLDRIDFMRAPAASAPSAQERLHGTQTTRGGLELPPPIWEDAPGFPSQDEIQEQFDRLADLPMPPVLQVPTTLRWGLQRPDLLRYNRVEGLSVGARGQLRPQTFIGPLSVSGTARIGYGDLEPNLRVDVTRETLRRKVTFSVFHELAAVDERGRYLGVGNSMMAILFGRDDGDYYRRSGASLEWAPPTAGRAWFRIKAYGEYHRTAARETDFALFRVLNSSFAFRPNLVATEGWEYGGLIELSPWWGSDPFLTQGGLDLTVQGGTGDIEYARASLLGRLVVPLPADMRIGLEAGAGTSWGSPSTQRMWHVGGARSLRGYDPRVGVGTSFWRARGELARTVRFGAVSLFSDLAWAGDRGLVRLEDPRYSIGVGVSVLDGLIRMDGAYGLRDPRGFRFDFYLDAIL